MVIRVTNNWIMTCFMWKCLLYPIDLITSLTAGSIPYILIPLRAVLNESILPLLAIFLASTFVLHYILVKEVRIAV